MRGIVEQLIYDKNLNITSFIRSAQLAQSSKFSINSNHVTAVFNDIFMYVQRCNQVAGCFELFYETHVSSGEINRVYRYLSSCHLQTTTVRF